jgi:hypothetical protein
MGDVSKQNAWVERVLGVHVAPPQPGSEQDGDPRDLDERLQGAGIGLKALRDAAAPEATGLMARYTKIVAAAKVDPAAAVGLLDDLEGDLARAISAARARLAAPPMGRGVAYRKLLLRWRAAQGLFDANLQAVGKALLARQDIQADPRLADIKQAVAALPQLVPKFGGKLEDVLDAAMNADKPEEAARLAAEGVSAVDAYRQQLAAAAPLLALEEFAARTSAPICRCTARSMRHWLN